MSHNINPGNAAFLTGVAPVDQQLDTTRAVPGAAGLVDRAALRLASTLLSAGVVLSLVAGYFHPGREPANDHQAAFAEYAGSAHWTAIHLGQFVGMVVVVAGLLALFAALNVRDGAAGWLARFGAIAAAVALALYGALQAVDGVALKQAVDAWAGAPDAEKVPRFASAETLRWLEWGVRSYHTFMLALAFVLFAAVIVATARVPRPIGYLLGLSGLAYLAQGWVLGEEGFSVHNTIPTLLGIVLVFAWSIWLLINAWRKPRASADPVG